MNFNESFKKIGSTVWSKVKSVFNFLNRHAWLMCLLLGILLNFTIECLHRHSFWQGILHIVNSPLPFLFNSIIISTVMSLCTLFKRRYFLWALFAAVFLGFGIANCVLLTMRVTPLEWTDLQIVKISLITKYLNTFQIVLIVGAILLAVALLVVLCIKCPKVKVDYLKNSIALAVYTAVLIISLFSFRATSILLSQHTKNLANAYKQYGFCYCFFCSVFDRGIDQPEVYTNEDVSEILSAVTTAADNNTAVKEQAEALNDGTQPPNVIFLQLETFFDVNHLSGVEFSENPIPNFSKLQQEYSSGYIGVPSIGAGTANTEFEIISGMSLEHFGMGEYPYKTILKTEPCESICYNLSNHGYVSHAIHNNIATFYGRNTVFSNLGFNTFTSLEYMNNVDFTATGWAKDNVLVGCIEDALNSTDGADLVYTITVQSHGKYPYDYVEEMPVSASGFSDDEEVNRMFEYYINQLHDVDTFVGELLELLSARDERTVVVMYGDHLPSFDISEEDLEGGNLFQTEYVIWDNFGLDKQDGDIAAYQLSSHVMGMLGYDDGVLTKLHQNYSGSENYMDWLQTLEYDMLYGEKYAWNGSENYPNKTTDLKMGVKDISISNVFVNDDGTVTVQGENFTEYSRIFVNDELIDTVVIDSNTLTTEDETLISAGDLLAVVQVSNSGTSLSSSKCYLIGGTQENPTVTVDSERVVYLPQGFKISTAIAIIFSGIAVIAVSAAVVIIVLKKNKKHRN